MGLFDFFKPKENPIEEFKAKILNDICPKGQKDIDAGANELLHILNNRIDLDTAKTIFLKSAVISRITNPFDEGRLKIHLSGYCINYFNDSQVKQFYRYLTTLATAMMMHRATPSEVTRDGDRYVW